MNYSLSPVLLRQARPRDSLDSKGSVVAMAKFLLDNPVKSSIATDGAYEYVVVWVQVGLDESE